MTVLAALHEPGVGTWIAADSLVAADGTTVGFNRKWIVKSRAALGLSGFNAMHSILEDRLEFDVATKPVTLFRSITRILGDHEFKPKHEDDTTPNWNFSSLFAIPQRVVRINGCGSVTPEFLEGFAAAGSGAEYAEGAAWALKHAGTRPREIVEGAVAAAMAWDRNCGGALWIDCLTE